MSDLKTRLEQENLSPWERLKLIMAILRSPEGCAWDCKQTHKSLIPYLIEESYEVVEAIETENWPGLKEELGDVLCQVVFHGQLASERGEFVTDDAVESINEKLIKRHPHVFGERHELNPQQVRDQWEKLKIESGEKKSVLNGLPRSMPALTMAFRIGEKAGGVGFDWNHPAEVIEKLEEEIGEIKQAIKNEDRQGIAEEIGDLLFATSSLARKLDIDPEQALRQALEKFRERFERLEKEVKKSGRSFTDYNLDELEAIWQRVKTIPAE
ncbi:MAG TPA: nucleoside triphosphate pyrophosphohydrolase [candidate division Zixibacteria bacterium]|nr:nucleoside triphosphate pyrophosphohydrolase [candidate division Zixibacteria bacterium]